MEQWSSGALSSLASLAGYRQNIEDATRKTCHTRTCSAKQEFAWSIALMTSLAAFEQHSRKPLSSFRVMQRRWKNRKPWKKETTKKKRRRGTTQSDLPSTCGTRKSLSGPSAISPTKPPFAVHPVANAQGYQTPCSNTPVWCSSKTCAN